eukprot:2743610-Prymnesium_polylepis.2
MLRRVPAPRRSSRAAPATRNPSSTGAVARGTWVDSEHHKVHALPLPRVVQPVAGQTVLGRRRERRAQPVALDDRLTDAAARIG